MRSLLGVLAIFFSSSLGSAASQCAVERKPGSLCEEPMSFSDKKYTLEQHTAWSRLRISKIFGVAEASLVSFFTAVSRPVPDVTRVPNARQCLSGFSDDERSRSKFLVCLAGFGKASLRTEVFKGLDDLAFQRIRSLHSGEEEQHTLALFAYLQDLIREAEKSRGVRAAWFDRSSGTFTSGQGNLGFDFQPGDVVLTLGDSSISAVISQATNPPRKYSHALVMGRKDPQTIEFYETLLETGSLKQPQETFQKRHITNLLVLRWKGKEGDATKIAQRARALAEAHIPYDSEMDFSKSDKLFCSEFVIRSISEALGIPIERLAPGSSMIRSERVFQYLKALGVNKRSLPSPGDLLTSEHFDIVSVYRNDQDFLYFWGMSAMADVWMERLDQGFEIRRSLSSRVKARVGALTDTLGGILGTDWNLLPDSLSASAAATIMTQEEAFKRAYADATAALKTRFTSRSLLDIPPWEIRGQLSFALQENKTLARRFRP
jgi:hypothetical protein